MMNASKRTQLLAWCPGGFARETKGSLNRLPNGRTARCEGFLGRRNDALSHLDACIGVNTVLVRARGCAQRVCGECVVRISPPRCAGGIWGTGTVAEYEVVIVLYT